jgi:hypothetical protein
MTNFGSAADRRSSAAATHKQWPGSAGIVAVALGLLASLLSSSCVGWLDACPTCTVVSSPCWQFVADVTIPDGTTMSPGVEFDKTWRVQNCDRSSWDGLHAEANHPDPGSGQRSMNLAGLGPRFIEVPSVSPGQRVDITAHMRAPSQPGRYRTVYSVRNRSGQWVARAGFSVDIVVQQPAVAQPPQDGRRRIESTDRQPHVLSDDLELSDILPHG